MSFKKVLQYLTVVMIFLAGSKVLTVYSQQMDSQKDWIRAGFAKVKITPEVPIRMSGYGARTEVFKGVHDDIFACAAVFDNGRNKACIITADVIGFSHEFCDETKVLIQDSTGIPEDWIFITAVHNHGGPRTRASRGESATEEYAYLNFLQDKLVQAVKEAAQQTMPVRIGVGVGTCRMNINRRARHVEGGVWLGRNPEGPCDHNVTVLRVDDLSSNLLGALVNWPCHAVVGGQDNYMITGDWPGAAARTLEEMHENSVFMMSAGASADINPVYGPNTRFNDIEVTGKILAEEVNRVMEDIKTYPANDINLINISRVVPGKKISTRFPNAALEEGPEVEIRMSSLMIGQVVFSGVSGELMTEIGMAIKNDSPFKHNFILSHCNGNSGYLCTDKAYEEGGYEPMVSRTMPGTAAIIRETFRDINNRL